MMYHVSVTGRNFEDFCALWQLSAKQLAILGPGKEVWEVICNDSHDYVAMQDAEEAWAAEGNEWEQLDTPWDSA